MKFEKEMSQLTCNQCNSANMKLRRMIIGNSQPVVKSGDYKAVSESLAINPNQIEEHRKLFPDVKVRGDGVLEFTSFKSHDKYLEQTGFVKHPQKIKNRI
jgi:hypothetical protein